MEGVVKKRKKKLPNGRIAELMNQTGFSRQSVSAALSEKVSRKYVSAERIRIVRSLNAELDRQANRSNIDNVVYPALSKIVAHVKAERRRQQQNVERTKWAVGYLQVQETFDLLDYMLQELQKLINQSTTHRNQLEAEASLRDEPTTSQKEILQ